MSLRATSDAVDEAVEAVRAQVRRLKELAKPTSEQVQELINLGSYLALVENNRAQLLVGVIAGRRGLDKLPVHDLDQVVKAIVGTDPEKQPP